MAARDAALFHQAEPIALTSARLELHPIQVGDMRAIATLHSEDRVTRQLIDGVPDSLSKAFACVLWNRPMEAAGYGTFAVRRRGDPAMIGLFSLTPFKGDESLLELGGKLAPAAWRGGLAVEAGAAMIDHAFTQLGRDRLISAFHPDNRPVPAALARLGFVPAASDELFGNRVATMTLTRADWDAQGSAPRHPAPRRTSLCDYGGHTSDRSYPVEDGPLSTGRQYKDLGS